MSEIPAGYYKARAIAGSEQYGKTSKGFDQIAFDLEILDGDVKGSRVTTFLFFSDDAAPYAIERLKACGWTGGDDLKGIDKNEVTAEVKYEQYNGKQQMKVDIATGGGRVVLKDQMAEPEKRAFFTKLNELVKRPVQTGAPGDFPFGANAPAQNYKL